MGKTDFTPPEGFLSASLMACGNGTTADGAQTDALLLLSRECESCAARAYRPLRLDL